METFRSVCMMVKTKEQEYSVERKVSFKYISIFLLGKVNETL